MSNTELKSFLPSSSKSGAEEINFFRVIHVFKKYMYYFLVLIIAGGILSYAKLRWTKKVYQSESIIKLNVSKNSDVLGNRFEQFGDGDVDQLVGEIEIIKSSLIVNELLNSMDLIISYFEKGNVLINEHYKSSSFKVLLIEDSLNHILYDNDVNVVFLDNNKCSVSINESKPKIVNCGDLVDLNGFKFKVFKNKFFEENNVNKEFIFRVNSRVALKDFISSNLLVEIENIKAKTIRIAFNDYNAHKAQEIVSNLVTIYQRVSLETKRKTQEQTIAFIDEQLSKAEDNLKRAEINLENFIISSGSPDPKSELERVKDKVLEYKETKKDLEYELKVLDDVYRFVTSEKGDDKPLPFLNQLSNESLKTSINQLNNMYREFELLKSTTKPNTLLYKNKLLELHSLRADVSDNLFQNRKLTESKLREINSIIGQFEREFTSLPSKETEINRLKRFYSLWESFYLYLINKKVEFGIAKAGLTSEFIVLKPPLVSDVPLTPVKGVFYGVGIGAAVFISLIIFVVGYLLANTVLTTTDIERASSVPIIGEIPLYKKKRMQFSQIVVFDSPKSSISEAFRTFRTNLSFMMSENKTNLISITSTISGEGKTFVALNMAGILAMSGKKVVLIDLDLRKPKVHLAFGNHDNSKGMSTILVGKHKYQECLIDTQVENFKVIPSGITPPNPSELVLRDTFNVLLEDLKKDFDYIIIDTPPVGLVTDASMIMSKTDVQLYVMKSRYTKLTAISEVNRLYSTKNISNMAVVLNAVSGFNSRYGYGYGNYGGYGYYEDVKESFLETFKKRFKK